MSEAEAGAAAGPPAVVRVRRDVLTSCVTCSICEKLLVEATAISECLHTFCRKCIFEKLTDEEVDRCPICDIDLGAVPVEKLRPDHCLQDLRARIFPFKRRRVEASDISPSITLPVRRKERSLSSLVVNTPRVATQRGLTGRRTKAYTRRASGLRRLSPIITQGIKEEDNAEDHAKNSSSHENLSKMIQNRKQLKISSNSEASNNTHSTEKCGESVLDKAELWKPLNCLVEAANRTKTVKSIPQSPAPNAEPINGNASEASPHNIKAKEKAQSSNTGEDENGNAPISAGKVKMGRMNAISRKRRALRTSAQALVDASAAKRERRTCPIWLSLVASFDEQGGSVLPQIDASYLRIKDGNLPVYFIHKYLVKKLGLANEAEVEVKCRHLTLDPMMAIYDLVTLWLQQGSSQSASKRVQVSVGAPAKDFVMMLTYNRKPTC